MKQENFNLPYYVYFSSEQLPGIFQRLNLSEKSERLLFEHLCIFAHQTHSAYIDIEDFVLYLLQWAERNNYSAFRIARNVQRHLLDFSDILKRHSFCSREVNENELLSLTLVEPELYILNTFYKDNYAQFDFANYSLYNFEPYSELFTQCNIDDFSQTTINESVNEKKILHINFFTSESHILFPYDFLPKLKSYILEIITSFINNSAHAKIVEDIIYRVKPLMQGIDFNVAKVDRLLKDQDKDPPRFLFYFARELSNQALRDPKKFLPVYQASRLLERFQLILEEQQTEEANVLKYTDSRKKMEVILQDCNDLIDQESFLQYYQGYKTKKEEVILFNDISQSEFETSFYKFLADGSQADENNPEPLPMVIRIYFDGHELIVHKDNVLNLFETHLWRAQEEMQYFYKELFYTHLIQGKSPRYLRIDKEFWQHVENKVNQEYGTLTIFLKNPVIIYNAFFLRSTARADANRLEQYFIKGEKPVFKVSAALLHLRREEIYDSAYRQLPYSHKFFIFRLLKNMWTFFLSSLFRRRNAETSGEDLSGGKKSVSEKDIKKKIYADIDDIEKKICAGTPIGEKMAQLENTWNIKIGEAHIRTTEEVIRETNMQVRKLSDMIQKLKRFDFSMAESTFKSIAETIKTRYPEIHNRKALEAYIILTAGKTLRRLFRG